MPLRLTLAGCLFLCACLIFPYAFRGELLESVVQLPENWAPPSGMEVEDPELALGALTWLAVAGRPIPGDLYAKVLASAKFERVAREIRSWLPGGRWSRRPLLDGWAHVDPPAGSAFLKFAALSKRRPTKAGPMWDSWLDECEAQSRLAYEDPTVPMQRALNRYLEWRGAPRHTRAAIVCSVRYAHIERSPVGVLRDHLQGSSVWGASAVQEKRALALELQLAALQRETPSRALAFRDCTEDMHKTHGQRFILLASWIPKLLLWALLTQLAASSLRRCVGPSAEVPRVAASGWLAWVVMIGSVPAGLAIGACFYAGTWDRRPWGFPFSSEPVPTVMTVSCLLGVALALRWRRQVRTVPTARASRLQHVLVFVPIVLFSVVGLAISEGLHDASRRSMLQQAEWLLASWVVLASLIATLILTCWGRRADELPRALGRFGLVAVACVLVYLGASGTSVIVPGTTSPLSTPDTAADLPRTILVVTTVWLLAIWLGRLPLRRKGLLDSARIDIAALGALLAVLLVCMPPLWADAERARQAAWVDVAAIGLLIPLLFGAVTNASLRTSEPDGGQSLAANALTRTRCLAITLADGTVYLAACLVVLAIHSRLSVQRLAEATLQHLASVW